MSLSGYQTFGPFWYDKNLPTVNGFSPSSAPWTNVSGFPIQVSLSDTGGSQLSLGRYKWTFTNDRPFSGWLPLVGAPILGTSSSTVSISAPGTGGQYHLHVEVDDTAGNVGYGYAGVYKLDKTNPAASVVINGGAEYTPSRNVTLALTYSDSESGVKSLSYRNVGGSESQPELPQATTAWTLTPGDGSKQVYVKATDNAGNIVQNADTIILDSRTSLLGAGISGTASGVMGETADSFQARAALAWAPDGLPLAGKTVFFHFSGSTKTALTDSLGAAATGFYVPTATGTYVYDVWFETDGTYSASSSTGTLLASQRGTTLITEDVNATSNAAFIAKATLKDFYTELPISGETVSFYFEGSTLTAVTNAVGVATVTYTAPQEVNFYDYNATYAGGAVYAPKTASSRVGVGLRVTSLAVPAAAALAQAEFDAQATLIDGTVPVAGATVSFYFQSSTQTALTNAIGVATVTFTVPASSGTYPFSAAFDGDGTYAASSGGALLTVNRRPLSLAGEMGQGYVDADFQARAVLYDGVTAQRVPGKAIVFVFENSSATVVTDALGVSTAVFASGSLPRSATVYYYFTGDSGYAFADSTAPVSIERRPVALSASDTSALINSSFTAVAELKDTAFTPVPVTGKTVTFIFQGEEKTAVTDEMGVASATYASGLSTGTYEYYASFAQDGSYLADNDTGTVTMDKRPVVVSAYPRFVFAFDAIQGVADLKDGVTGEYISSQTISFNYNGVAQSTTTGSEGAALGRAYTVYPGTGVAATYSYSATFPGNSLYSANSSTASITVTKRSVNLTAFPQSAIWGSSFTATAEFRDGATNTLVGGKQLRLAFSTAPASFHLTSAAGVASSTFTAPASTGAFNWFANFAGDDAYAPAASTGTISVNRRAPTVTPVASSKYIWDSIYLSATFADEGNPVPDRQLYFYFNGSTKTATTNTGGVATTLAFSSVSAQGVYSFTVQFNGDTNYSAQSGSSTVTVSRRPSNLNLGPVSAIANSSVTLSATLIDSNLTTPVAGQTVNFTLQGATHTLSALTDASGVARVIYSAAGVTGPYTYSASFAGNPYYSGTSGSDTLTVTLRPSVLEMADYYPPASSTFTASAVLKDFTNGDAISGKTVSFLFLNSTRTAVTSALGYAATSYVTLSSTMSYPIQASYPGDSLYGPATIIKTVYPGRRNTSLQTSDTPAVAKDTFTVTARLSDYDLGTYLSGASITFSFTGSTYTLTAVTDSTGLASVQFKAPTSTGTYSYTASYSGNALYNGTMETSSVLVNRRTAALNPSDLTGVPAISTFPATAVLSDGALLLADKSLSFVFVSTKSALTNPSGVAVSSFIAPVSTGTFSYKVTFAGDALYNPATAYATLGVILKPTVLEVLDVDDAVVGLKFAGTAKLRDIEAGNALVLSTKTITFTFKPYAVTYTSSSVTEAGVSTTSFVAPLSTGTYAYTAAFAGDGIYGASTSSGTVTVNRRPVLFSLATDPNQPYAFRANSVQSSFTITGVLSDGQVAGLNLAGQTLTFVFQNSTQTAVTNDLGVASVTFASPVSSGTYSYFGYFYGDNSYNPNRPEDSEKNINIIPRPTNILPRDSATGLLNNDGLTPYYTFWNTHVQARVMDTLSSEGIQGVTANFVLWNSTRTGVTNSIGTAQSSATFAGVTVYGTYPAVVRFDGNGTYAPSLLPGGTNTSDPYTGKVVINRSPAYFDVPQITETYPDADTVITGNLIDWWGRPPSYAGQFVGDPNAALIGYPIRYRVSTIACGADCGAVGRNWAITGWGTVGTGNIATATVHSPLAAGDYPIDYYFAATNSYVQWSRSEPQRVLRVGRRLTYIIPDSEPFTVGAQMPIDITVKLADLTQSLAGVNGKNLDVILVTTQTLVTGSAGPAGKVKATFAGMSVGTYTYIARFPDGDPAYMPFTSSGTVVVEKNTTGLAADNVSNVPAGNNFDARATLTIVQGTTTFPLAGKTINFVFTSTNGAVNQSAVTNALGVATVTYSSPYVPANYNYTAEFPEDADNKPSSDLTNTVQIVKRRTQVAAQNAAVYIQENFISTATLTDLDLEGAPIPAMTVSYILHKTPDVSVAAPTDANGVAVASFLSPASANDYEYSATFPGTSIYAVASDTKTVTVSRRVTNLNAADVTTPTNSSFTITTSLSDVTHNLGVSTPIAGAQVKFVFNGTTKYAVTDAFGVVSATFTAPGVAANYPYTVYFEGNQTFDVTETPRTIIVRKRNTTVSGTDVVAPAGSAFTAQALLIDEFGQKLEGYTINFVFTGTGTFAGSSLTDENGLAAKVYTSPLSTGTYNYTASFAGDDTYAANSDDFNEVLVNVASTTLSVPDGAVTVNMVYTATATLKGKTSGVGVPNKPVDFTFNGVNLGQVITDETGVAIKTFTPASTGTYRLDVDFYGDSAFYASESSATITVNRRAADIASSDVLTEVELPFIATATLRDFSAVPSVPIAGRTVQFWFEATNSTETAVTNSVGVATVSLTSPLFSDIYDLNATFPGDAVFDSTSALVQVNVAKHEISLALVSASIPALEVFNATATLTMGVVPVPGKLIQFLYKGQPLSATTDDAGQAFVEYQSGASSGPWRLDAQFDGSADPTYASTSTYGTITVLRRACVVVPENITMSVFDAFTATATFKDVVSSSTPAGKQARIGFNWLAAVAPSTKTTTVSDSFGQVFASTAAPVSSGTYKVEAFYLGDATYAPSLTSTATVTVLRRPSQLTLADAAIMFGEVFTATATLKNEAVPLISKAVTFTFEGRTFTKLTKTGGIATATFTVTQSTGPSQIDAAFDGDASYGPSNVATATVTAAMRPTSVTPQAATAIADKVFIATATLKDIKNLNVAGKQLDFIFDGQTVTAVTDALGVATAAFTADVATGTYGVEVHFNGTYVYVPSSSTLTLTVNRRPTSIQPLAAVTARALDVFYATATLRDLDSIALGVKPVRFLFQNATFYRTTDGSGVGISTWAAPASSGSYIVGAYFDGDAKYAPSSSSILVANLPRPTGIALNGLTATALDLFKATATLTDLNNGLLQVSTRNVTFSFSWGASTAALTNGVGLATAAYNATATAGEYQMTGTFAGDATYASTSTVVPLTVAKRDAFVTGVYVSTRVFDVFTASGTFYDSVSSAPVADRTLTFVLQNGSTKPATTDANGLASVQFTAHGSSGTYALYTKFTGDATYNPAVTYVSSVTLARRDSRITLTAPASVIIGSAFTAGGTFYDAVSNAARPSKTLSFLFQGSTVTRFADAVGYAGTDYTAALSSGAYELQVSFAGDASYNPSVSTRTVTALRYPTRISGPAVAVTMNEVFTATATLTDYLASTVPAKALTFTFDSRPFVDLTDGLGVAYSTYAASVASGTYQLPVTFAGDALYDSTSTNIPVLVDRRLPLLTVSTVAAKALDVFTASATLADNLYPAQKLAGQTVVFEFVVGASTFTGNGVTDAQGLAVYNFTAPAATGDYQLRGNFAGNSTYYPSLKTSTVTVSARPALLSLTDAEARIDELFRTTATLTDQATQLPVATRLVTFNFGTSSGAYTAADGEASVGYAAPPSSGAYQVDAAFAGDATYAAVSSSATLTVLRRPLALAAPDIAGIIDEVFKATATATDALNAEAATGLAVNFVFNNSTFTAPTGPGGVAVSTFAAPSATGVYYPAINFPGDARYLPAATTAQLTVDRRPASILAEAITARAAQVFTATATLRDVLTPGYKPDGRALIFHFEGSSFTVLTDAAGLAVSTFMAPSSSGSVRLNVSFEGDARYTAAVSSAAVTVLRRLSLLTLEPVAVNALDVFTATATLTDKVDPGAYAPGRDVIFHFAGTSVTAVTDALGNASASFSAPLSSGVYQVEATFEGDSVYDTSYSSGPVDVLQRPVGIAIADSSAYPFEQFAASGTLSDAATAAPVAGRTLLFTLDGAQTSAVTDGVGVATAAYTPPDTFGDYELGAEFAGDATYAAWSASGTVSVMQRPTAVATLDAAATAMEVFIASASLSDVRFGTPVEGKEMVFLFEGQTSTAATDAGGLAWTQFAAPVSSGTYLFTAEFQGDPVYAVSSATGAVTVSTRFTRTVARDTNANVGEPFVLSATLTDPAREGGPGYLVPNVLMKFIFKDRDDFTIEEGSATTNELGVATVTFSGPGSPDVYYYTAFFEGDYTYSPSSATAMVKVGLLTSLVANDVETEALENFKVKAKLTDYLSTTLDDKLVRFAFLGDTGSGMTNAEGDSGVAASTFTAPPSSGTYNYYAYFDGDSIYSASNATGTITVKLRTASISADDIEALAYSSFTARITLKDLKSGGAIGGRDVELYFNGSTVPVNTNASTGKASASFFAPFSTGEHQYHAYFPGDDTYAPAVGTGTLTVALRPTNMLSYNVSDLTANSTFTARVQVKDNNNLPIEGLSVDFNFEGQFAVGTTDAQGLAEVGMTAPASSGTYTYSAVFYGDERYAPSNADGSVAVGPRPTLMITAAVSSKLGAPLELSARLVDVATQAGISGKQLSFYFDGATLTATTDGFGISSVAFASPASTGSYYYEADYAGDGLTYLPSYSSSPVTIALNFTRLEALDNISIKIYEPLQVQAMLLDSLGVWMPGLPVTFAFEGAEAEDYTDEFGRSTASFPTLLLASTGTYNYTAEFAGDTLYVASSDTSNVVNVGRRDSLLTAGSLMTTPNKPFAAAALLSDNVNDSVFNGAPVSGRTVLFEFFDSTFTQVSSAPTSALGISSVAFTAPASTGTFLLTARFADDDPIYTGYFSSAAVVVMQDDGTGAIKTKLTVAAARAYLSQVFTASATLTATDEPVPGKAVLFEFFNGVATYPAVGYTDGIGLATAAFTAPASSGAYIMTAYFAGDAQFSAAAGTGTLTAERYPVSLVAQDVSAYANEVFRARAVLRDDLTLAYVPSKTVSFSFFNGISTLTATALTSSTGSAEVEFTAPGVPGDYFYTATFEGDAVYLGAEDTASLLIASRGSSTFLVGYDTGYEVSVGTGEVVAASATLTSKGYPVPGKPVAITFQGVTRVSTTNAQGLAFSTFTTLASSGTFIYQAEFTADANYNAAVATAAVLVVFRKQPEPPVFKAEVTSTSVTLAWAPVTQYQDEVKEYIIEQALSLRGGASTATAVAAGSTAFTCDVDEDESTFIKIKTRLNDEQVSPTTLVVEVPSKAADPERVPNYYYMSPGENPQDWAAWVRIPGKVMDKVSANNAFDISVEKDVNPDFLAAYTVKAVGAPSTTLEKDLRASDRKGVKMTIAYPQGGTGTSAAGQVALYWHNGVEWIKLGGEIDVLTGEIYTYSRVLGQFAVRADTLASEFTLTKVAPRIFTPDAPDATPGKTVSRATFYFENPSGGEVTIRIFDITGALVRRNLESAGASMMFWDGRDQAGAPVKGGVYIYQVEAGEEVFTGTVVVAK
ncbi:MAG: Ig-like domain repeat protein [Elusimicrobiales bacterium]